MDDQKLVNVYYTSDNIKMSQHHKRMIMFGIIGIIAVSNIVALLTWGLLFGPILRDARDVIANTPPIVQNVYIPDPRCEEEIRRWIFSSPRVIVLDREPGPFEGQYWHYHRFSHIFNTETQEMEWVICSTHWFDYPVAYPMVARKHERCEDPNCELPRFYQPDWRRRGN